MSKLVLILFFVIALFITPDKQFKYSTVLDLSKGKELLDQCSRSTPKNIKKFWNLSTSDVYQLEKSLVKEFGHEISKKYGFQYIGINIKNEKHIYINAFAIHSKHELERHYRNWKIKPIIICDGASDFWGVSFNLETSSFDKPVFNGP